MVVETYLISSLFFSSFSFIVDKCAKCDSHARCDNGNCVCMEGWVGDGQTCSPKDGGGCKYTIVVIYCSISNFLTPEC